jgi:ribosome biogenesis GTPase / thiamine phosphate phosphatase
MTLPEGLVALGWDERWAEAFAPMAARGLRPARVVLEHQHIYRVHLGDQDVLARVTGRARHRLGNRAAFPAVGDWVALRHVATSDMDLIDEILPRRSRFVRKAAGQTTEAQVVAANVDVVFIVSGLDNDFNIRRIERYLLTAWDGGAQPVIVLNKADLRPDLTDIHAALAPVAGNAPVEIVSAFDDASVDRLRAHVPPRQTAAFLGSSGVGKSTLINRLIGEEVQRTAEVRAQDSRGRHTTTHRELIVLPDGSLLIDTPGMRELQLWDAVEGLDDAFEDIRALADGCRFRDCGHDQEPDCAVRAAADQGRLHPERLVNYLRLAKELAHTREQIDERTLADRKRLDKVSARALRGVSKLRDRP